MINILDLTLEELKLWLKEHSESSFRAKQIFDWIYKGVFDFQSMKNLPQSTIDKIQEFFYIEIPQIVETYVSLKDETTKFLLAYKDGNIIECVLMKYKHGNSICVSTQIGCKMGCKFCASTIGGLVRNLTSGEILAQVLLVQKEIGDRISNIVMMGSGEPLDNYENSVKFMKLANAEYGLNIGQRHITVSTCGIVPKIIEMAGENLQITLAISLHAPNDDLRKTMMPISYQYSIKEILEACKLYIEKTNRRITFEYALVKDVNDSELHAHELCRLLKGMLCHVNLIPVNTVRENVYIKSSEHIIKSFSDILMKHGIEATVRREMGSDINAACGQLRRNFIEKNK